MSYPIYVYKIFWSDCEEFYIGSTKEKLCKRMSNHRNNCKRGKQFKLYNFMREKGTNTFQYVLISTHNVCSKDEQRQAEQKVIDELKPTLNTFRAFCSEEQKKERKLQYNKEYKKANKEEIKQYNKEYQKQYHKENLQQIKQRKKEYYVANKERIAQREKEYRIENRERILQRKKEKIQCDCGTVLRKGNILRHLQSGKHQFYESIYNFIYS